MSARSSVRRLVLPPMTTAPIAMPTATIDPIMLNNSNVSMALRPTPPGDPCPRTGIQPRWHAGEQGRESRGQGGFVLHGFLNPPNEITAGLGHPPHALNALIHLHQREHGGIAALVALSEVGVDLVAAHDEARFRALMQAHHYLGALPGIGETLRYVAHHRGQWLALVVFSAPALKCAVRDRWIGWSFGGESCIKIRSLRYRLRFSPIQVTRYQGRPSCSTRSCTRMGPPRTR